MFDMKRTQIDGLVLLHAVPLGEGVASNIARLVRRYAELAGLTDIPSITLDGELWAEPWDTVALCPTVHGNSGPSAEEARLGRDYRCFFLSPTPQHPADDDPKHPEGIEGTIAHEITHLRWWNLQHGPEFYARVRGLLRGATFPPAGGWPRATHDVMRETRAETAAWLARLLARRPSRHARATMPLSRRRERAG